MCFARETLEAQKNCEAREFREARENCEAREIREHVKFVKHMKFVSMRISRST